MDYSKAYKDMRDVFDHPCIQKAIEFAANGIISRRGNTAEYKPSTLIPCRLDKFVMGGLFFMNTNGFREGILFVCPKCLYKLPESVKVYCNEFICPHCGILAKLEGKWI